MAVVKISELPAMQTIAGSDLLPIVDTSETETKKVTKQMLLTDINAEEVKIGQLTEASQINDEDYLIINQSGTNKKISKANAKFASGDEVAVQTTEPTGEDADSVKVWINPEDIPSGTGFELNKFYPVGSIYINTTGVNPSTFMGGTWQSFGAGKVLVGQDTNDTDFDTLLETGGSKYLQEHSHNMAWTGGSQTTSRSTISWTGGQTAWQYVGTDSAGTGNSGNLQPYIVVSMWVRTA